MMPASAPQRDVHILKDGAAVARRAAEKFVQCALAAVSSHGSFAVALAGGSTPKAMYTLLATDESLRNQLPWDKMQLFFGDERHVGPNDPQSNYKMATETMISNAPLKPEQVHRMMTEYPDAEKAAREYEQVLQNHFHIKAGQLPHFDLVLIGMGDEGHCLSLFPGTKALHPEPGRIVVRNWVGKFYTDRVTITAPVANNAASIIFTVTGKEKAPALKAVFEGPYEPEQLPSQLIQPTNGELLWLVDNAAATMLSTGIRE
jgi:6-phosphogluconolactonase